MSENRPLFGNVSVGSDTIIALGSPVGRGAIAVIRLSGDNAVEIARRHIDPWPTRAREVSLCRVRDGPQILDQALIAFYNAPQSFTGEDVVEIFTHGGHVVPLSVVAVLIGSGARQALPGEFTRRALLNGKLDIVQAEAIGDLVDAQSSAMQRAALHQLDGGLSSRITSVREGALRIESLIAYDVDFPEEDDGPISKGEIAAATDSLVHSLDLLLSTIPIGQIVREGAIIVIAGAPNVGKSSLFNALVGESRAIVTDIPGTTRDAIEATIDAGSWPVRLIDTAGLRDSTDVVERLGIEVSEQRIAAAHLVIACGDTESSVENATVVSSSLSRAPVIQVLTKDDLRRASDPLTDQGSSSLPVRVSVITGNGLSALRARIDSVLDEKYGEVAPETPILTRARHIHGISIARDEIEQFKNAWEKESLPVLVAAVHLRAAVVALEELIGAVSVDDVLERVFSSFCVGK
ncbi:MAG: tRNA uridine-5-carboxymethylaminomethyl(34) synthesis GTPase MnmE [Gemmatimonadaceae bacterium]